MKMENNQYRNIQNRHKGAAFESLIDKGCDFYRANGAADIRKTPEPMKPLQSAGGGKMLAVYTKKAQPDYKGVLKGGKAVMFEAKATDTGKMYQSRVTPAQTEALESAWKLGAVVFVLCAFNGRTFARVPWELWRDMKEKIGRKYLTPGDVAGMLVPIGVGGLRFLE